MFVFVVSFIMYLLLSWSGSLSVQEVTIGFCLAAVISFITFSFSRSDFWSMKGLNPRRWWNFFYFVFVHYSVALWEANVDLARRVITGEINPGIAKYDPRMKTDIGRMMLILFIVLVPGTYPVDVDEDGVFYIHSIFLTSTTPPEAELDRNFSQWLRRIAE